MLTFAVTIIVVFFIGVIFTVSSFLLDKFTKSKSDFLLNMFYIGITILMFVGWLIGCFVLLIIFVLLGEWLYFYVIQDLANFLDSIF